MWHPLLRQRAVTIGKTAVFTAFAAGGVKLYAESIVKESQIPELALIKAKEQINRTDSFTKETSNPDTARNHQSTSKQQSRE